MGKMKELLIEMEETGLSIDELMGIDEHQDNLEEAHYEHTMRDVIDLMVVYGFDVVMDDIKDRLEGVTIK